MKRTRSAQRGTERTEAIRKPDSLPRGRVDRYLLKKSRALASDRLGVARLRGQSRAHHGHRALSSAVVFVEARSFEHQDLLHGKQLLNGELLLRGELLLGRGGLLPPGVR